MEADGVIVDLANELLLTVSAFSVTVELAV